MSADSSSDAAKSAGERLTLSAVTDGGTTALLQTDDHCEVRLPLFLLPRGAGIGSVLRLSLAVDEPAQRERVNQMIELQQAILDDRLDALPDVAEGAAVARKPAGHK